MITLHHAHETRSMRTLWLLLELGLEFHLTVYPFDKTLRSEMFRLLHPAGRVPVLEIDGEVLIESGAICEYLCERFPDAGLGRMPGDIDRADWLVWTHFAETITQHAAMLTLQYEGMRAPEMRSAVTIDLETRRLAKCFETVENRLSGSLEGRDKILPSGFSAADINVAQAIYMGRYFVRIEPYPALQRWYEDVTARPAFKAALPPADARMYSRDFYDLELLAS
ncbi:MAG: glutathione S-transferase family protein [Mangrovicoccus sp.]|nr:glutathione S-transferase family protein [Mangrovicoccus sp.]